jgi:hypothetical protein
MVDWTQYAVGGAAARGDSFTSLNPSFRDNLSQMLTAAEQDLGPGALRITSAYRSPELQGQLYEAALERYGSPEAARKWVAPPGNSQHNYGTAVDFAGADGGLLRDASSAEAQWLRANAERFGLAVPMDWEPWQVELAGARDGNRAQGTYSPPAGNALAGPAGEQQPQQRPGAPQNALERPQMASMQIDPREFMSQRMNALDTSGFNVGNPQRARA